MFIKQLIDNPVSGFSWLVVVIFSVCFHELMHAVTAKWQGDPTAADAGHITLNPLKQMGLTSIFMLLLIGIAWGAVPVNPQRMRHKYSDALVSFAGPLANLFLTVVFIVVCSLSIVNIADETMQEKLIAFFGIGAILNLVLFVFNMLPIPSFDGWHVFCHFFPKLEHAVASSEFNKGATLVVMIVLFSSFGKIFEYAGEAVNFSIKTLIPIFS